tara:strand:- start:1001 stop:1732 length:732 start_codon:yes stop_codon:yes gene_type:complete
MRLVKLDATDSTNAYLKELMRAEPLEDATTVVAQAQTLGRGQMGSQWTSERGKNLLFSVLKKIDSLSVDQQFYLSMAVSLAVLETLKKRQVPGLAIKWPNDILSGNSKICGILIENILSGPTIKTSIIGIGLNVNQTRFVNLPNASSLKLLLGIDFDLDDLLEELIYNLGQEIKKINKSEMPGLKQRYLQLLYGKDRPANFRMPGGQCIAGVIKGVSEHGKLIVAHQQLGVLEYDLKEIKLLY